MQASAILPPEEGWAWLPIAFGGGAALLVGLLAVALVTRARRRSVGSHVPAGI